MSAVPAPAELREIATTVADAAAALVRGSHRHRPIATKSTVTDIVTATDLDAEALIAGALGERTPGSRLLGEEGGHRTLRHGPHGALEWVVDPLDGTVNFAYGLPISAVSVAAAVGGRVVAGAVVDVGRGEVFSAHRGGGATRRPGDAALVVGERHDLARALVATGYSYDADRRARHGATIASLLQRVRDVRAFGSAALQCCWVGAGRLDAYVERDIKPWDYAAGTLIAAEAGASVELPCIENDGLVLVANPTLARALRPLVA